MSQTVQISSETIATATAKDPTQAATVAKVLTERAKRSESVAPYIEDSTIGLKRRSKLIGIDVDYVSMSADMDDAADEYMDDAAKAKRAERQRKAHFQKLYVATPNLLEAAADEGSDEEQYFADEEMNGWNSEIEKDESDTDGSDDSGQFILSSSFPSMESLLVDAKHLRDDSNPLPNLGFSDDSKESAASDDGFTDATVYGTKRRGSQVLDDDSRYTPEAISKRGFFEVGSGDSDAKCVEDKYVDAAKSKRRKHAKRKSSVALPPGFFADDDDSDSDEERRRLKRTHARKQSLLKTVGDKGYFSGGDEDKVAAVDTRVRRAKKKLERAKLSRKRRRSSISAAQTLLSSQAPDASKTAADALGAAVEAAVVSTGAFGIGAAAAGGSGADEYSSFDDEYDSECATAKSYESAKTRTFDRMSTAHSFIADDVDVVKQLECADCKSLKQRLDQITHLALSLLAQHKTAQRQIRSQQYTIRLLQKQYIDSNRGWEDFFDAYKKRTRHYLTVTRPISRQRDTRSIRDE